MARRRARPPERPDVAGVPPELRDPEAEVWRDTDGYVAYMRRHGWGLPARDRLRVVDPELPGSGRPRVAPQRARARRLAAAAGWARQHQVAADGTRVDWRALRALVDG